MTHESPAMALLGGLFLDGGALQRCDEAPKCQSALQAAEKRTSASCDVEERRFSAA
jgi:hypothetical protein